MEEWGLQAVVRGVPNDQFMITSSNNNPDSCFDPFLDLDKEFDQELLLSFPDLFETAGTSTVLSNELEELYKPFCPNFLATNLSPQAMAPSPSDMPIEVIKDEENDHQIMKPFFGSPFVSNSPTPALPRGAKHKTRKNQQKKVVLHVTADGLASDLWAWRKYGQKPIKGSPYPRSYYRCSSSKGCLARRQVEQSCSNAGMYIITYTAEHNHAKPTRRNSLAGINRHKFGTLKNQIRDANATTCNISPISSPSTISHLSSSPVDQEEQTIKEERRESEDDHHEQVMAGESDENEFVFSDIMLSDDFFADLGNLDEIGSDLSFRNHSTMKFPVSFCS